MYTVSGVGEGDRSGGGKRGEVKIFSAASRYRLFQQLHKLEFETVTFITLTYPAIFPTDPKVYKANLKEWRRRFEEKWGKVQAVWRLEFQKRGAPHFHIMYLDCPFIPIEDMCWMWKSVTHTMDMAHEILGVDLKLITSSKEEALIASYLGKYIAKVDERIQDGANNKRGRWWGRWNIIEEDPVEVEITDREAELLCNFALASRRGNSSWEPIDPTICTLFGSDMGSHFFMDYILGYTDTIRGGREGRRG
jgi:hypothetical protein